MIQALTHKCIVVPFAVIIIQLSGIALYILAQQIGWIDYMVSAEVKPNYYFDSQLVQPEKK